MSIVCFKSVAFVSLKVSFILQFPLNDWLNLLIYKVNTKERPTHIRSMGTTTNLHLSICSCKIETLNKFAKKNTSKFKYCFFNKTAKEIRKIKKMLSEFYRLKNPRNKKNKKKRKEKKSFFLQAKEPKEI